jgi:hypothetical protein
LTLVQRTGNQGGARNAGTSNSVPLLALIDAPKALARDDAA